jgi:hypothetical protein
VGERGASGVRLRFLVLALERAEGTAGFGQTRASGLLQEERGAGEVAGHAAACKEPPTKTMPSTRHKIQQKQELPK